MRIIFKKIFTDILFYQKGKRGCSEHINTERNHSISKEEAVSYIKNSLFSISVWNGKYENFYSEQGAVYVNIEEKMIRTAFSKEEFDDMIKEVIQVVKKYEK